MTSNKTDYIEPEWSHLVDTQDIEDRAVEMTITPDQPQREKLAQRLGIVSLDDLTATLKFERTSGGLVIHVKGRFKARVTQECVVSMAPVESELSEEFEAWFADPEAAVSLNKVKHDLSLKKGNTERPILEEYEDPEPVVNGHIDAGELVAQYLLLAIDPYPHAEGVHFEVGDDDIKSASGDDFKNPFAALKDWKGDN